MFKRFKAEIFLTIPTSLVAFVLVCTSLISQQWVTGMATVDGQEEIDIQYNYGLFKGEKTRTYYDRNTNPLSIVCDTNQLVCMMSCGEDGSWRASDIQSLFLDKPCDNSVASDLFYCHNVPENCTKALGQNDTDLASKMMRYNTYVPTVFFLVLALKFTVVSIIFSSFNTCHTPISMMFGVQGLMAWNAIAATSYFLSLTIFAGEYQQRLTEVAPISDLLRPPSIQWSSEGQSSLGYSYWLVLICFFLHVFNVGNVYFYITHKHKTKRTNVEVGHDDNTRGNAILY